MDAANPPDSVAGSVPVLERPPTAAYARLSSRAKAILIDAAITGFVLVLLVIVGSATEDVPGSGRIFLLLMLGWLFLYEPLQVWLFGSTIGHRRVNLRVVSDKTGGPPSLAISFARFLIKGILGFPSFVSMAFTRRYQAIHDLVTGTTVQLRDISLAEAGEYLVERVQDSVSISIPASRSRRMFVTLLYIVGAYLLSGILSMTLVSDPCLSRGACSTIDSANSRFISYVFFLGALVIAIQGFRGRLWGARSRIETAPVSTRPDETKLREGDPRIRDELDT
jgi:uncharacterized RDD family membrane protein YckC